MACSGLHGSDESEELHRWRTAATGWKASTSLCVLYMLMKLYFLRNCTTYFSCAWGKISQPMLLKGVKVQGYSPSWQGRHSEWQELEASSGRKQRVLYAGARLISTFLFGSHV